MDIYITNFAKPDNSTGRPATANMTNFSGQLKNDCSVQTPTIILDLSDFQNDEIAKFNYAYIPLFHRYYWVTDTRWIRGLWEISLTVDVLATYKTTIGAAELYVLRAYKTSGGLWAYDSSLIDNIYPVKTGCDFQVETAGDLWPMPGGHTDVGCYCIGVVSKVASYGSIQYYILSRTSMVLLVTKLLDDAIITNNGFSLDDASLALQKSLIDPLSYIKSCTYLPFSINDISVTAVSSIEIFGYTFTLPAYIPNSMRLYKSYDFTRPTHPDTNSRGNWVNCSPYTLLTLNIPPFGLVELDTTATCNVSQIGALVTVDVPTGSGKLEVIAGDETIGGQDPVIIASVKSKIGVPISLSQVTRDYVGAATSAVSSIGKVLHGDFLGAVSGVGSAINSAAPHLSTIGSTGAFADLWSYGGWNLTAQFYRPVEDDVAHHGRPFCRNRVINTLQGYIQVQDGDILLPNATLSEHQRVREYLESGFYYE